MELYLSFRQILCDSYADEPDTAAQLARLWIQIWGEMLTWQKKQPPI